MYVQHNMKTNGRHPPDPPSLLFCLVPRTLNFVLPWRKEGGEGGEGERGRKVGAAAMRSAVVAHRFHCLSTRRIGSAFWLM